MSLSVRDGAIANISGRGNGIMAGGEGTYFTATANLVMSMPRDSYHRLCLIYSALIVRVEPCVPAFHPATHTHMLSPHVGTKSSRIKLVSQWVHPK
jgi:hypothetical protein